MEEKNETKAMAAKARAESLTPERRKEIAQQAANSRWADGLPVAIAAGTLNIGELAIDCAVLDDNENTRVLTQDGFVGALGRTGKPKVPKGVVFELPVFLRAGNLKPFISQDLIESSSPIPFRGRSGRALGFRSTILPDVCWAYMDADRAGVLSNSQRHVSERAKILLKGLTNVAIEALVDEATGFQEIRRRDALQRILDRYLGKELGAWAKHFNYDFYEQIFRLRGWENDGLLNKRPGVVGKYTKDFIYMRIAPGILEELETKNPKNDKGNRKARHHQWFSETGIPKLDAHIHAVTALMRVAPDWNSFKRTLQIAFPKLNSNLEFPFEEVS